MISQNFWFLWKAIMFDPRHLMLILLYQLIICRLSSQNLVNFLYIWCASNTTLGTSDWSPRNCLNKKKLPRSTPSASLSSYYTSYTSIFPALCCNLVILFSRVLVRITFDTDNHLGFTGIRQGTGGGIQEQVESVSFASCHPYCSVSSPCIMS
jgi:hypothetical protein